ncbi:hypothetical protein MAR_028526 [Mya arenaria]|uniref:Protein kinase domain-containing protein n=1 Tax=Mya arenaria TaxID=6604 RepID=A0ABY7DDV4_MYAAR|nr:hypothetical protein MAR_028526 [Mya arenaria]
MKTVAGCTANTLHTLQERGERIKAVIENIRTRSKKLKKKALVPATKKVSEPKEKEKNDRRETQPGTPAYQAPEILLQARRGRTQADVWSLCCSLVELFTAKTIWDLTSEDDENDDSVQI